MVSYPNYVYISACLLHTSIHEAVTGLVAAASRCCWLLRLVDETVPFPEHYRRVDKANAKDSVVELEVAQASAQTRGEILGSRPSQVSLSPNVMANNSLTSAK